MRVLYSRRDITRYDAERMYSGIYLDAVVSFERFVEALFLGYLTGRLTKPPGVVTRITFRSDTVARDVLHGGRRYIDWFPYDQQTVERAKAFFRGGFPFTSLVINERNALQQVLWIRNAIAHKSHHAMDVFERQVIAGLPLVGYERSPAGFLRSMFRTTPAQTRYENLMLELASISQKLTR